MYTKYMHRMGTKHSYPLVDRALETAKEIAVVSYINSDQNMVKNCIQLMTLAFPRRFRSVSPRPQKRVLESAAICKIPI